MTHPLDDTIPGAYQTPGKFGVIAVYYLQATFASGVATADDTNTSQGVTIVKDATGDYDVTFPSGEGIAHVSASLDPASDTPTANTVAVPLPRSFAAAGTGKVLFAHTDDGGLADPEDTTRLYLKIEVRMSGGSV